MVPFGGINEIPLLLSVRYRQGISRSLKLVRSPIKYSTPLYPQRKKCCLCSDHFNGAVLGYAAAPGRGKAASDEFAMVKGYVEKCDLRASPDVGPFFLDCDIVRFFL